jgi:hypothetical protein
MEDNYKEQAWYSNLSENECHLLEYLRTYQNKQGNMGEFKTPQKVTQKVNI